MEIKSQAFPRQIPFFIEDNPSDYKCFLSPIHETILREDYNPNLSDIYFKDLTVDHVAELRILFREWFPIQYSKDYLTRLIVRNKSETVAFGAFVTISGVEYIVGNNLF